MVRAAVAEFFPIWQRALQREGYDARERWTNPDGSIGGALDVRVSTEETGAALAEYFTKFVALELTGAVNKRGKGKGLTRSSWRGPRSSTATPTPTTTGRCGPRCLAAVSN